MPGTCSGGCNAGKRLFSLKYLILANLIFILRLKVDLGAKPRCERGVRENFANMICRDWAGVACVTSEPQNLQPPIPSLRGRADFLEL